MRPMHAYVKSAYAGSLNISGVVAQNQCIFNQSCQLYQSIDYFKITCIFWVRINR